jgi:putative FmdB family regulatory protein
MPIYEYECDTCGSFSGERPMALAGLPARCPRCARKAPRVLSATAIGGGRGRRAARLEPSLVVKDRPEPKRTPKADPLRAPRREHGGRPWMLGH